MNPLFLLLGILGTGFFGSSRSSGSSSTVATDDGLIPIPEEQDNEDQIPDTSGEDDTPDTTDNSDGGTPGNSGDDAPVDNEPPRDDDNDQTPAAAVTLSVSVANIDSNDIVGPYTGAAMTNNQSLVVETSESVGSVAFYVDGNLVQTENLAPYTMFGDNNGDIFGSDLASGDHQIQIQAYSGVNGEGDILAQESLNITIEAAPVEDTPPAEDETPPVEDETPPAEDETPPVEDDNTDNGGNDGGGTDAPSGTPQTGDETDGGEGTPQVATSNVSVYGGRVTTLDAAGDDVSSVRIVNGVEHGKVTVNPDNTMALVMTRSDFTGNQSFTYEVTHTDGSTSTQQVNLEVQTGLQADGWATGEYQYMLETDEDDNIIVEAGDIHTKVYVSGSNQALSVSDIAQMEGVSTGQVNGAFLAQNGYGQSEGLALDENAAMTLWNHVTPAGSTTSNWFLFERGYAYDQIDRVVTQDATGEDENHPILIGAWGEGELPEITNQFILHTNYETSNVVIQDLYLSQGANLARMDNIILDGVVAANETSNISDGEGITIRNSAFLDASDGDGRTSGLFMGWDSDGVLLEGNFFDHNGWTDGYENGSGETPTMFSHNLYLQDTLDDVTLRDTFIMRAAAQGVQVRSGGFIEDNVFIDNQTQLSVHGGDFHGGGPVGFYSLVADNLVTSAGHKIADNIGAYSTGLWDVSAMTSYVDNIVAHLADPNGEESWKIYNNGARSFEEETFYDDTIVYNWEPYDDSASWSVISPDRNVEGLDTDILDQTTIQLFAAQLLGQQTATIDDLATYLRAQYGDQQDTDLLTDDVIRYFQESFGIASDERTEAMDVSFVPNDLGEGIRWDNRLNWDSGDLAGTNAGDNVDLRGNDVVFGHNTEINTLDLGTEGWLNVYGGRLDVNGGLEGDNAEINIEGAGQLWANGSGADGSDIDITATSGRFANTGDMSGVDLHVSGSGTDAILATDNGSFEVGSGHTLRIDGGADVGFDDDDGDMAILDLDAGATIALGVEAGELGSISEFSSGAFGEAAPDVQSGIDLGDAALEIDLSGLSSSAGNTLQLMSADEIVGMFDDATVGGLGARNANLVIDYENDTVTLQLSAGNGSVTMETVGEQSDVSDGAEALWQALTADQGIASETQSATPETQDDDLLDAA